MMLAYDANQSKIRWLLDMWSYQWQPPSSALFSVDQVKVETLLSTGFALPTTT